MKSLLYVSNNWKIYCLKYVFDDCVSVFVISLNKCVSHMSNRCMHACDDVRVPCKSTEKSIQIGSMPFQDTLHTVSVFGINKVFRKARRTPLSSQTDFKTSGKSLFARIFDSAIGLISEIAFHLANNISEPLWVVVNRTPPMPVMSQGSQNVWRLTCSDQADFTSNGFFSRGWRQLQRSCRYRMQSWQR